MKDSAITGLKEMSWSNTVLLGMTGATAGVASGLLGIGGGTVVTPLLAILTPLSQVQQPFQLPSHSGTIICTGQAWLCNDCASIWLQFSKKWLEAVM